MKNETLMSSVEGIDKFKDAKVKLDRSIAAYDKSLHDFHKYWQKVAGYSNGKLDVLANGHDPHDS